MELVENFLTLNPCYKAGKKIVVKGLMLHSVGCPQPSADVFAKKWNNAESSRACVHAFIDANTGKVVQTLPWDHRGWHGGGSSNNTHIGVEMCEPSCIRYTSGASFICSDKEEALKAVKQTYDTAVKLFAMLCKKFGLNPLADGVIVSHKEGHERGIASGHADPEHLWSGLNSGYTMDGFRKAVAASMEGVKEVESTKSSCQNFCQGDRVRIMPGATYYGGKEIPDWVISDEWIVKSVNGDRVVIDLNVRGDHAICSPVSASQLSLVSRTITEDSNRQQSLAEGETKAAQPSAAAPLNDDNMQASQKCVELVAKYEGCRLEAYKCPSGVWTIGYGHTAGVEPGSRLPSKEAAQALLKEDLAKYAKYVSNCVKNGMITFQITQNQFDALTSFCYNCGNKNLQNLVSGRNAAQIAEKMLEYNKGGGKVLAGLVKRREEERQLFLS